MSLDPAFEHSSQSRVRSLLYTIEFQKRSLPHFHSLLWVSPSTKVWQDNDVEKYILAELPDPTQDPDGYRIISELMMHGSCGYANKNASCMKDGNKCNQNFSKPYCDATYIDKDGFIHYRRRDTNINIERQEGTDRVVANITTPIGASASTSNTQSIHIDEIKNFVEGGYIGPHEVCWRILEFPIHYRDPAVLTLVVHLENMQQIRFRSKDNLQAIVDNPTKKKTTLTEFKVYTLHQNMHLSRPKIIAHEKQHIQRFSSWLLDIGDGNIGEPDVENSLMTQISNELCIPNGDTSMRELIHFVYDTQTFQRSNAKDLQKKVIVCPKNETADTINSHILSLLNEQERVYLSSDEATHHGNNGGETELLYPNEYLNSLNFPGLPRHKLQLKVGAPIILLRNLNLIGDLCNETRMIVTQLLNKVIEARIITGTRISEKVFLPRISLINRDLEMPFVFKRKKFLVKLSYAMTINKIQGQSLEKIGIFLPEPVFAHGQLYVALSRATSPEDLKIQIKNQPKAHIFAPDCNELVNPVENKDDHCFPDALKQFENTTYIFQYHFGKKARPGHPNFSLDAAFKTSPQPLQNLPGPDSTTSTSQEVLQQTTFAATPTPSEIDPHELTKDVAKVQRRQRK
uniref:ATP-dependent DNA helicase n=1 Tax=Tanacetum cinerariifolium TaxID=118510 RepID=A0A6L2K4U1_TANCI|nr:DNA helicase [Tanacetum cinerariifolium]